MWVIRANNHIQVLKGRTATIRPKAGTANKNYTTAFYKNIIKQKVRDLLKRKMIQK